MKRFFAALAFGTLALSPLCAGDIYRWVDDKGQVQLSDNVPEQFKKSATRVDSRQYELTPGQRKEAEARAAREKARLAKAAAREAKAKAREAAGPVGAASAASAAKTSKAAAKPASAASGARAAADCATLRRRYQESADCLAPFLNVNGSIKEGAFETCGPAVPYPASECSSTPLY